MLKERYYSPWFINFIIINNIICFLFQWSNVWLIRVRLYRDVKFQTNDRKSALVLKLLQDASFSQDLNQWAVDRFFLSCATCSENNFLKYMF